ncbi:UNVERIFIED_CONTAM: hypothetical protein Sradi_3634100 [Sesamum radiatum]|uniref:Uncharacterized protein n=1 Tax=Sesamum radiatum TaxID=300843 RepID=A0AAW2QI63_SESRA
METPNVQGKQKVGEALITSQALQVVSGTSLAPITGSVVPTPSRPVDPAVDPARHCTSSDISSTELSPVLLGIIQQMITTAIREQLAILGPVQATIPSKVGAPEEVDPASAVPEPNNVEGPNA